MKDIYFSEGDVVFREGDPGETMYIIVSGSVSVYSGYETESETIVRDLSAGELFGEMALLEKAPRSTTIVATSARLYLQELDAESTIDMLTTNPAFVRKVMTLLSNRLRSITNDYKDVMSIIQEIEDSKKFGLIRSDGLLSRIKFYVTQSASHRSNKKNDSLEKIWGERNRRSDRNVSVRGRTCCDKKRPIFREGDKGDCMYYVFAGKVDIYSDFGNIDEKLLTTVDEGGFFGEMGMIEHLPRSATAIAQTNDTYIEQIFEEDLNLLVEQTPEFVIEILAHLSNRLRKMTNDYYEACRQVASIEEEI